MNTTTVDRPEAEPDVMEQRFESHPILDLLDARVDAVFAQVQEDPYWRDVFSPTTAPQRILVIFREIFLSVHWYQSHTTEAGYAMIGRLPKGEQRLLKLLLLHKTEEAEHGLWALRDYLKLGGREAVARHMSPDPATFAVAAVWWRLALHEEPWAYLGAEYLFEYLTARVTKPVVEIFQRRGLATDGMGFVVEHATEDVKHTLLIRSLIAEVAMRFPGSEAAMLRGFDYFRHVYPLPVWRAAHARAATS